MKKKYRALVTADLHASNRLPYSKPIGDGVTDRLQDLMDVIERMNEVAKHRQVDASFVLGDIFDRSLVDAVTLTHTAAALSATPVPLYIMAGNHDANSIRGGRFTVEAFGAIEHKRMNYLSKMLSPTPWLNFIPIPFMAVSEAEEKIKSAKKMRDKEAINVLLFHNSVLGCDHLEWTCDDGLDVKLLTTGFNYALGGHFHEHQVFGKKENGMYVGAPMHHNFGDRGRQAGFWIIDFYEDGEADFDFIDGEAPKFHVVKELKRVEEWSNGDYVRVEIEATHTDWTRMKVGVKEFCDSLDGIKASYKHKPIYHHKERLSSSKTGERITIDGALGEYVDNVIVKGRLNSKRLKRLGLEILQGVRGEHGIV